jgi:hypothetical protein
LALVSTLSCQVGWGSPGSKPEAKSVAAAAAAGDTTALPSPTVNTVIARQEHSLVKRDILVLVIPNLPSSEEVVKAVPTEGHLVRTGILVTLTMDVNARKSGPPPLAIG